MPPVELDPPAPPDPAIARWQELAERDIIINHGGDAETVMPFPRPAWADPDCDMIGNTRGPAVAPDAVFTVRT
ncbi:hypothetical protein [Mycolicibacterium sp.]|uniref:hypothetical protein n=1 Tax=Mycolicibacterium sp. TaxID=2320850 RepID=UPI003D11909C